MAVAAAALACAPSAAAVTCIAPPGTAAGEEYCENIPDPGGDRPAGSPSDGRAATPAGTRERLARSDPGRGLLAFSEATSPRRVQASPDTGEPGTGGALGPSLGDGPWTRGLVPWLLLLISSACVLLAARRRRTSTSSSRTPRPSG